MRVLVVTNMYPSTSAPAAGLFVKREVEAVRRLQPDWDVEVVFVDTIAKTSRYLTGAATVSRAAHVMRPEVTHVHYGLSQLLARGVDGPKVVTFHGSDLAVNWQRRISRALLGHETVPILVSDAQRSLLPRDAAGRAVVVPCGVDERLYHDIDRESVRARMGWAPSDVVVAFPASPSRKVKRYGLFRETIRRLTGSREGVRIFVFDGVAPDEVAEMLGAVDLLLMTSEREGSPVIVREALAAGTRVVSTAVGDVAEQLAGLSGCRVVVNADAAELARACADALEERPPGQAAARRVFTVDAQARAVAEIYRRAVSR